MNYNGKYDITSKSKHKDLNNCRITYKDPLIPNLHVEPIKQEAWHIQIKDEIKNSKKMIDTLSLAEIRKMYQEREFFCDSCSNKLEKCNFTLEEHILHMINPLYYWCCEDCFQSDLRNDRIISMGEEKIEDWKIGMQ